MYTHHTGGTPLDVRPPCSITCRLGQLWAWVLSVLAPAPITTIHLIGEGPPLPPPAPPAPTTSPAGVIASASMLPIDASAPSSTTTGALTPPLDIAGMSPSEQVRAKNARFDALARGRRLHTHEVR